jgi:hypothetical protein
MRKLLKIRFDFFREHNVIVPPLYLPFLWIRSRGSLGDSLKRYSVIPEVNRNEGD